MKIKNLLIFLLPFLAVAYFLSTDVAPEKADNNLLGTDKNNNGIRDNVENYLNETFRANGDAYEAAMSYTMYAQAKISKINLETMSKEKIKQAVQSGMDARICLLYRLGYYAESTPAMEKEEILSSVDKITAMTWNNTARKNASKNVDLAINDMKFTMPENERIACSELYWGIK